MCAYWAVVGECERNAEFMNTNCAPVCFTCERTHAETRCPLDPSAVDAFYQGDLNKMFERIISDPVYEPFQVSVISRPGYVDGDGPDTPDLNYKIGPWILQFDNITTPEEAQRIVELGSNRGYERSSDLGKDRGDGTYDSFVNDGRTSTQTVSFFLVLGRLIPPESTHP